MAIIQRPDGTYYSNKTGEVFTREQVYQKLNEKRSSNSGFSSIFSSAYTNGEYKPTGYEQTGALENAIQGNGRGVDVSNVQKLHNANSYQETDSDKAARLREASNILGFDDGKENLLMQTGMNNDDIMKSALALAKKKQSEPDDWEQFAADHPATVKYLEQQKNMSISYDDIKPLGKLEDTANQVKTHLEMMELEEKIADLGRKYDSANMSYNDLSADQRVELNDLLTRRKELAGNIDTWSIGNVLGGLLAMKEDLPMALAVGLQTGLVGAGAGAVAGGVGAIPGALTGFGAGFRIGMGASMGYRMAGTQYAENMMRADANGQYMDAHSLRQGAWGTGLGMTVLGSVGVGRLTNKLPVGQIYDKFLRTTSPSVLNNPAARETAWKGYLSTLGVGLKEAAIQDVIFGGGTSALTFGANRYSEALSGLDYSNREDGTLIENIVNGMKQFAPMALATGVGFSVAGKMASNAMGKKNNNPPMPVADGLNKTMDAVNETKTAGRSPQATREAVNTIFGENASAQDVEINARGLVRLCQEADPENPNLAAEVAQKLGVDEKTLNEAVQTDDTVKVSVTDFVTEMKDSDLRQEMLKEVKDVDGVTENERGEILTYQQQAFEKNLEFIKAAANAEYDHNDPAWTAAYEATQNAYPKLKPKDLEQLTNVTYAGFKQMEERGILQLNGFENAEQAIRALEVRRVDAPRNATLQELEQRAWVGSPADFNKFDLGYVGTGEGAQAHGYGLYSAGDIKVAEGYRERLSSGDVSVEVRGKNIKRFNLKAIDELPKEEQKAVNALLSSDVDVAKAIKSIEDEYNDFVEWFGESWEKDTGKEYKRAIELLKNEEVVGKKDNGKLYKVEIPDNDVLLDEQKPLKMQPEKVQKAIRDFLQNEKGFIEKQKNMYSYKEEDGEYVLLKGEKEIDRYEDEDVAIQAVEENNEELAYQIEKNFSDIENKWGKSIYKGFSLLMGGDKEASQKLNELGVKGITYEGGRDGRCYVVFDDKAMEIINKYNNEQQAASDVAKETTQALFQKAETTKENTASVASDDEYFAAVQKVQNAASEAERGEAQQQLADMVEKAAAEAGFENAIPEQTVAYATRTKAAPKKSIKVYKVFTVSDDGAPTALFIGGTEKLPQGVWLDAQAAYHFEAANGKYYVPSTQNPYTKGGKTGVSVDIPNDKVRQELIERGFLKEGSTAKKITALAYRPGWHAGTLPFFPQGGMKPPKGMNANYPNIHRYNQVVFECELAADKDFTREAENQPKARKKDGSLDTRNADLQYMPEDGYYYYATNPMTHGHPELGMWAISGSLKINRALSQEECDRILAEHNMPPQEWEQGKMNLADLGYTGPQQDAARKTLAPITYDDDGNVIPLSKRFNPDINDVRYQKGDSDNVLAAYMPQGQGRAIIELYKNANPSSLAHEMLHHWVFLHENAYRTGKMEGQVLQDFQKLAEFAGHELGTEWSEAEHEKLASAWETYLSEGKAPSLQLVSTFERFKNWMKCIYQTLVRHSIPINDDVRGVFDRMLASDKELEMAQAFYESEPLFAGREMGAAELREYAALVNASHKEAQREMDKRVMAEVNPAMKEIRDNVEANLREDIAGKMMMEPVYAARALFTAPLESADFKAAKETAIKNKIEERLDLLVKQSALGVEKKGMIAEDAKQVSQEWFGGFSNNYDWYKEMFKRRGGKIPASWYRFIQAYKNGEKTLKQMPKTMRAEYEYIANEQLTHGHKESMLGDIPEDIEFVNLKENNPAMSWIVQNGGGIRLDRQSVYERFGKGALPERWLTDKNGYTIDEVADYVYDGQGSGDRLFQDLTTKPTFAKELNNRVRAGMAQFKEQEYGSLKDSAIKAVHNAKSLEAICLDLEIFEKNAAEFKSKQEQKTADAIAEGREKSKWENKIADEKQKGKEALENQKLADEMHYGAELAEQKRESAEKLADAKAQGKEAVADQKLADSIYYGGKMAEQQRKSAEELDAAKEKLENQKLADSMHFGRKMAEQKREVAERAAREQRWLDAAVMRGKVRAKMARAMAQEELANTKVGEVLGWQKYAALAKKAGDEAVRFMSKGDYEGAIEAKNREIICHALAREAGKMDTEINKTLRYFNAIDKRGNKMKGIPHEFNVQIDNILFKYNLLSREPLKPLEGDKSLQTFINDCQEDYFTPQVADFVINGRPQHYSWLTVNELRDLKSSVESIRHVGRQMDALVANEKKQRISDIAASMVEQLSTHEKKYALEGEMGAYDKTPLSVTSLVKAETLLRLMDKGEENGVFVRNIYNPIKLGLDDMANRSRKIIADVDKLLADTGWTKAELAKLKDQEHTFDFMPNPKITHEQVLHAALNWGNEGNRDRLRYYFMSPAERKKGSWTPEETAQLDAKVMQMFEVLTEKDLKLVQGVWDYLETYAPEIRKHEIDCAGVDPKMVEPTAFSVMTADGKVVNLKGGYYPIRYDSGKSVRAMDLKEANNLFKNNSAVAASVAHGHTKERTNHLNRPLLLDWSTFTDHLRNVNYDLAMRKPIMDVSRLLRRDDVQSAIAETFGNDNLRMLQTWVRDVATDQREALTFTEKAMRWTRTRMSVAFLGFRTKALFIDLPQNFITAAWQNGADSVIKGVSQFYLTGDYREKIAFVNQRSPMMRDKASFMDANLADLRTDLMDGSMSAKLTRIAQKTAFCCDMFSDSAVNYPTWIRYWEEATARGLDDAAASLEADAKVRRQSVDTSKAGMAAVQRGGEGRKLLTPFYSYFSAFFNRLYYDFNLAQIKWADGQQMDAAGLMVRTVVLGVGIPTMIEAIMQGVVLNNDKTKDKKKREENMYKEMASASFSYLANTVPVGGAMATFAFNKAIGKKYSNYELTPVEGAIENLFSVPSAVVNYVGAEKTDKDAGRKLAEAVAKAAAVGTPYPNMLNTLALNIWDVMTQSGDFTLADLVTRRRNQK